MKVAIIGCGNMGGTYARAVTRNDMVLHKNLLLIDKNKRVLDQLSKDKIGRVYEKVDEKISKYDVVVVGVKPQIFPQIAKTLKKYLKEGQVVLSIMAGITIKKMSELLEFNAIVRSMPNTPAQLGFGATAYTAHKEYVTQEQLRMVDRIFSTTGKTIYMEDEALIDSVTALSGSGPAYFFYFMKALVEAGVEMGLDEATSKVLAKQTMLGSFHLINNSSMSLQELMDSVASKGGTTEAALNSFEASKVADRVKKALKKAKSRAKELSK